MRGNGDATPGPAPAKAGGAKPLPLFLWGRGWSLRGWPWTTLAPNIQEHEPLLVAFFHGPFVEQALFGFQRLDKFAL